MRFAALDRRIAISVCWATVFLAPAYLAEARPGAGQAAVAPIPKVGHVVRDCADCPPMVAIPPVGAKTIAPGRPVLYVARHELTWSEYLKAVRGAGCVPPGTDPRVYYDISDPRLNDDHPVYGVSIPDFQCYLAWINAKTGKRYRLPTPEEWEHAARAGTTTNYPWGDDLGFGHAIIDTHFDAKKARMRQREPRSEDQRSGVKYGGIYPVESLPPNGWGLYDVIGNVREVVMREHDTDLQCIRRLGLKRCHLIETRGGDAFRSDRQDYLTKSELARYHNPHGEMGYRIVKFNVHDSEQIKYKSAHNASHFPKMGGILHYKWTTDNVSLPFGGNTLFFGLEDSDEYFVTIILKKGRCLVTKFVIHGDHDVRLVTIKARRSRFNIKTKSLYDEATDKTFASSCISTRVWRRMSKAGLISALFHVPGLSKFFLPTPPEQLFIGLEI